MSAEFAYIDQVIEEKEQGDKSSFKALIPNETVYDFDDLQHLSF